MIICLFGFKFLEFFRIRLFIAVRIIINLKKDNPLFLLRELY